MVFEKVILDISRTAKFMFWELLDYKNHFYINLFKVLNFNVLNTVRSF